MHNTMLSFSIHIYTRNMVTLNPKSNSCYMFLRVVLRMPTTAVKPFCGNTHLTAHFAFCILSPTRDGYNVLLKLCDIPILS